MNWVPSDLQEMAPRAVIIQNNRTNHKVLSLCSVKSDHAVLLLLIYQSPLALNQLLRNIFVVILKQGFSVSLAVLELAMYTRLA